MTEKPVLDRIFDDFITRLRKSGKLADDTLRDLDQLLRCRELRPEHIRKAIFTPEDVA